jgi:hypothetical protein
VVQLLLSGAPHTTSIEDKYGHSPLDWALERVKRELKATERLSRSDPLIALLRTGKLVEVGHGCFSVLNFQFLSAGTWREISNCRFSSEFRTLVAETAACHDCAESFLAHLPWDDARRMLQGWSVVRRRLEDQRRLGAASSSSWPEWAWPEWAWPEGEG